MMYAIDMFMILSLITSFWRILINVREGFNYSRNIWAKTERCDLSLMFSGQNKSILVKSIENQQKWSTNEVVFPPVQHLHFFKEFSHSCFGSTSMSQVECWINILSRSLLILKDQANKRSPHLHTCFFDATHVCALSHSTPSDTNAWHQSHLVAKPSMLKSSLYQCQTFPTYQKWKCWADWFWP